MIPEYLLNPYRVGIYSCRFDIQIDDIITLLDETVNFDEKEKRQPEAFNTLRFRDSTDKSYPWIVDDFKDALTHLEIYNPKTTPLGPWRLKKPYKEGLTEKEISYESILDSRYRSMIRYGVYPRTFLSSDQAIVDKDNSIHVDFSICENILRLDVYSIKEQGTNDYKEFLESIPIVGRNIKTSSPKQRFSSRYCYKAYPSAVVVWAYKVAINHIPIDILQYFIGAVRYYAQREWRISIVLSAIAVETILAELYEEKKHEPAPPDTLGTLFSKISKMLAIPNEVRKDVEEVNNKRILSVHRSSMEVGDREACSSLVGATRFANWVYFCGSP